MSSGVPTLANVILFGETVSNGEIVSNTMVEEQQR